MGEPSYYHFSNNWNSNSWDIAAYSLPGRPVPPKDSGLPGPGK